MGVVNGDNRSLHYGSYDSTRVLMLRVGLIHIPSLSMSQGPGLGLRLQGLWNLDVPKPKPWMVRTLGLHRMV